MARKTKKTTHSKTPTISELGSFKLGDIVWFRCVSGKIYEGTIVSFHSGVPEGPCATMMTTTAGSRTTLLSDMSFLKEELKKIE